MGLGGSLLSERRKEERRKKREERGTHGKKIVVTETKTETERRLVGNSASAMSAHSNIVLCFDGTDSNFGSRSPSNILELYKVLEKNSNNQHCFYQRMYDNSDQLNELKEVISLPFVL